MSAPASDEALHTAVRQWLEGDASGQRIMRLLAEDPAEGARSLLDRLQSVKETPAPISTAISGGQIGYVINVASAEALNFVDSAPSVSPGYVKERLRLGWNCFHLALLMSAAQVKPGEHPHPSNAEVIGMVAEINDVFGVNIDPPLTPMPPRNYLDYFVHRIESKDRAGGSIFRIGGCLFLWWEFKGSHEEGMDTELWSIFEAALLELGYSFPRAPDRVRQALEPLRPGKGENEEAEAIMDAVAAAVAG